MFQSTVSGASTVKSYFSLDPNIPQGTAAVDTHANVGIEQKNHRDRVNAKSQRFNNFNNSTGIGVTQHTKKSDPKLKKHISFIQFSWADFGNSMTWVISIGQLGDL